MPVVVNHGRFALRDVPQLRPVVVPAAPEGAGPVAALGHALVVELARAGWDVPDVDVLVATRGVGRDVYRAITKVSGTVAGRAFNMDVKYVREGGRVARVFGIGEVLVADEEGYLVPAHREATAEIMRDLLDAVAARPTSPDADGALSRVAAVERIPAPEGFPTLFVWEDRNVVASRVGRAPREASLDDVVVSGDGWRATSAEPRKGDASVSPRAFNGFSYAGTDLEARTGHFNIVPNEDALPIAVDLKWLNDVFVMDRGEYLRAYSAAMEAVQAQGHERLSGREVDACTLAAAATMVPASEYDGSFDSPVYLVGRQLLGDEARLMTGPTQILKETAGTRVRARDEATGRHFDVWRSRRTGPEPTAQAGREAAVVATIFAAAAPPIPSSTTRAVRAEARWREPEAEYAAPSFG